MTDNFWDREEANACFDTASLMIEWIRSYAEIDADHADSLLSRLRDLAQLPDTSTRPKGE